MLCKPQHFSYSFLHALAYDAHHLSGNMVNLLAVAVILEQYEGLYQHLRDIDYELGPSEDKQHQLNAILFYTLQRDGEELVTAGLQLQDICSFANTATSALANARGNWEKERAVNDQLERLLAEAPVEAWAAGFQALAV